MTKRSQKSLKKRSEKGKASRKLLGSSLVELEARINKLDEQLKVIGNSIGVIWSNQRELSNSEAFLDEQFAVLTRMTVMSLNSLMSKWNRSLKYLSPIDADAPPLTEENKKELVQALVGYSDINALFVTWSNFRRRKDFRNHMKAWVMGEDITLLPPEPPEEKKEGESNVSDPGNPTDETQLPPTADCSEGPPAAVPEV